MSRARSFPLCPPTALRLPASAARFAAHARYLKLRERTSYAFAVVSAAACLRIEDGVFRLADYRRGQLDTVKAWNYRGRPSVLYDHAPALEGYFRTHPPATVAEARAAINEGRFDAFHAGCLARWRPSP